MAMISSFAWFYAFGFSHIHLSLSLALSLSLSLYSFALLLLTLLFTPCSLFIFTPHSPFSPPQVVRYSWYGFKDLLGSAPFPLTWLRYTLFIVLYPLGVYVSGHTHTHTHTCICIHSFLSADLAVIHPLHCPLPAECTHMHTRTHTQPYTYIRTTLFQLTWLRHTLFVVLYPLGF